MQSVQVMVQFKAGIGDAEQVAHASGLAGEIIRTLHDGDDTSGDLVLMRFADSRMATAALSALARNPVIAFAELDSALGVQGANDTYYANGSLWGMYGDKTAPYANAFGSQAGEAWDAGRTGSTKTVIGVIDTGLDYTHPDLYLNVWLNQKEIPLSLRSSLVDTDGDLLITFRDLNAAANSAYVQDKNGNGRIDGGDLLNDPNWENGINEDGNGYTDDLLGWDFVNNDNDPYDDNNHGTHVSGTIGAIGNNGTGVAGVNWAVQIMPLKFLDATGTGYTSNALLAADYYTLAAAAAGTSANYVATSNSWGGGGSSQALLDAITRGAMQDVLFIAAAGNGGTDGIGDNNDLIANYPSNYSTLATAGYEAVVAVAAITSSGALASFSNYGAATVDLGAPGQSTISTVAGGGYASYSGTSMAAPHVSGAIALLASLSPAMTAAELRTALLNGTAATASLSGLTTTGGRLDIPAMLALAKQTDTIAPTVTGFSPADGATEVATGSSLTIAFSESIKAGSGTITISKSDGTLFESYNIVTDTTNLGISGNTLTINPTGTFAAGTGYVVTVAAGAITDLSGNAYAGTSAYDFVTASTVPGLNLTGTAGNDTLTGDAGADILNGLGGTDILDGKGAGDLYLIASASEHPAAEINDTGASGIDEARYTGSSGTFTLYAGDKGIELVAIGTGTGTFANTSGTGSVSVNASALANGLAIIGNDGANTITGTNFADTLTGNGGNDSLSGNAGADTLHGNDGNDSLNGGAGADALFGGAGDDTYTVDDAGDTVSEESAPGIDAGGTDLVKSSVSFTLGSFVERLTLTGTAAVNGTGNALANTLTGNGAANVLAGGAGNDSLNGGAGADTLFGGAGDDTYTVDDAGDTVSEESAPGIDAGGTDLVSSSISFTLGNFVEKLTLTGTAAVNGTGNALDNTLTGNAEANALVGGAGNDTLSGGSGNDMLAGGEGANTLTGGIGADAFRFDILETATNKDTIKDFEHGIDHIELSRSAFAAFAGDPAGALSASAFALGSAAVTASEHIIYNNVTGALYYDADGAGGVAQVQIALLSTKPLLDAGDFLLI